jgi:methylmalonyl-CoA mutase, N-terminal domain
MMRFHTQTGGSTLTAQQPENNIVRVALQGFAAVCGGTQSLHTNGFDEALGLPTERSAKIALRTQQVIAHESGAADTVDPFAGSYYVEHLTADIEDQARALMQRVEDLGGSVHAIEAGFLQREIEEAAWAFHTRIKTKQDVLVGVNEYVEDDGQLDVEILRIDPHTEQEQVARLKRFKEDRDQEAVARRLQDLRAVAQGDGNLLYPIKDALRDRATIGEVCNVMREVFGEYKPPV